MSLRLRRAFVFCFVAAGVFLLGLSTWRAVESYIAPPVHIRGSDRPDGKEPVAFELSTLQEAARLAEMGDFRRFASWTERGDVFFVDRDAAVRIIDRDGYYSRVEILDGQYRGRRAWLPS